MLSSVRAVLESARGVAGPDPIFSNSENRCFMRFLLPFLVVAVMIDVASGESVGPNVVLILVDDMGLHDLSIEGSTFYRSPNIDKLARGGMRFTQGYATCRRLQPFSGQYPVGAVHRSARRDQLDWCTVGNGMET